MAASAPAAFKMPYRFLGNSGLQVSALSFGCWVNTGSLSDDQTTKDLIKTALSYGVNFIDTAETYGDAGSAEISLGKVLKELKPNREDLVITTKLYWSPTSTGVNSSGLSRKRIIEGTEASLARLQLPYVDVIYAHRPDPYTPLLETIRGFNHVINQGKAHYWGTSEWEAEELIETFRLCEKHNLMAPITEQPEYNLYNRTKLEKSYLPLFKKWSLGTTIWSPLASGLLTGKYNDGIPKDSRLGNEKYAWLKDALLKDPTKLERAAALAPVAKDLGCTQAQLALAWCLKNPNVSTVITGASSVKQFVANMGSLDYVDKLTPELMGKIDSIMKSRPDPRTTMRRHLL